MSRLDDLIKEYCPDGVSFKKLGELTHVLRGKRLTKKELSDDGLYPVYHGGLEPLGYYHDKNREANTVMVINVGASAGTVGYCNTDFWSSDGCYCIGPTKELLSKFVYSALAVKQDYLISKVRHAGIPTLDAKVIENLSIPVPPIEVQREIVRILDNFTELTAQLTAELTARKQQYQHYLDRYFEDQTDCLIPLREVGTLTRGKRFVHADAVEEGVPCIHYGELYTYYGTHTDKVKSHIREELRGKMRYAHKGDVIIVGAGENNVDIGVGVSWEGEEDVAVHDACYTLSHSQNPRYISYYLKSHMYHEQIKKYVSSGKICAISAKGIGKALIPIPSPDKQKAIVSVLDRFETLCNGISEGIPAEIECRKQQYVFYRDSIFDSLGGKSNG